jgi:glycosyltransferase involved in cell wall biosynthesis
VNIRIPEPLINIIPAYVSMTGVGVPLARKDVSDFISEHRPLLASVLAFRPEYGINVLLGALKEATYLYPSIGLVIIGSGSGRGYISQQIADMKLQNHICMIFDIDNKQVIALLSQVDILLRTTFYDGDSISVREALSRGTPVIASNTGFRPDGVIKFQVGNQADLLSKLVFVLNNIEDIRLQLPAMNVSDYFDQLLHIYKVN